MFSVMKVRVLINLNFSVIKSFHIVNGIVKESLVITIMLL